MTKQKLILSSIYLKINTRCIEIKYITQDARFSELMQYIVRATFVLIYFYTDQAFTCNVFIL